MIRIDWDEYKEHKKISMKKDNFEILLEFIKSYYNETNPREIFHSLEKDDIALMMLEKRSITSSERLEDYLMKL